MSLTVQGATLLDPAPQGTRRLEGATVRIEDGRIEEIGDRVPEADRTLDGSKCLLVPGFVNAHTHAAMTLLRGYAEDLPLHEWLHDRIWPAEAHLTPDAVHTGTLLGIAEMLANGVTAFADMYLFPDRVAQAAHDAGIRCLAGASIVDADTPEGPGDEALDRAHAFLKDHPPDHDNVRGSIAPHSAYACSGNTLESAGRLAHEHDAKLQIHAHETRREVYSVHDETGRRPLEQIDERGCLTQDTIIAHGGWMTKQEASRLTDSGACLAHCPTANMKLATGATAPVPEVHERGGRVVIGTDGPASNNRIDPLEDARMAALVQKNHRWDAGLLPAHEVFAMATHVGAKALGFKEAGRVQEGAWADLALVSLDRPGLAPVHDPVTQLVHAAGGGDVVATVVDGRVVYEGGQWPTMDVEKVMAEAGRHARELAEEASEA